MILPKKAADVSWALLRAVNFETEHLAEIVIPVDDPRRGSRVEALRLELRAVVDRALEANREVGPIQGRAILSHRYRAGRHYTVLATCSLCKMPSGSCPAAGAPSFAPAARPALSVGPTLGPTKPPTVGNTANETHRSIV